jgi:hypothetical protein
MLEVCTLAFLDYVTDSQPARPASPGAEASSEAAVAPVVAASEPPPRDEPPPRPLIVEPPHFRLPSDQEPAAEAEPLAPAPPPPAPVPPTPSIGEVPPFLLEVADRTAQIMRADSRSGPVFAGFYPDGGVRFVGSDGVGYEGRSENAVANLTEHGGTRSVRLQVGVSPESKLQITVDGGLHDGETLELEMVPERLSR